MSKYRLPTAVRPLVYDLRLNPDLVTGLFTGKVIINVTITETTNNILLHIKQLKVSSVKFNDNPCSFEIDDKFELLIVSQSVSGDFVIGDGKLEIDYDGDMNNRIVGLYKSTYTSSAGTRRNIATSKFEPTYARQAFPCFDEPNMKAVYNVHILKPKDKDYIALSNLPVRNIENVDDDNELVHFEETDIRMSTYLACFIVADFKSTDSSFENNGTTIPFKVYTSPEQLSKTEYAGSFGKRVIEYYINYFGIPYPLPKLDMVAIPDFVSGAMEHWGLVTFTETALLYTNETHSSANQQRVAEVVAHELAHSWFGNLVTMNWWNDLWLNEGFASYIQYKGTNEVEPSWKMMDQFLIGDLHSVLSLDATLNSHPIIKTVITPDQITEVFDIISYNKGASILRMLESALGETIFSRGVTKYLQKYAYRNAVTDNFWEELQSVVEDQINVKGFMDTFTVQMGYPIVDVAIDSAENYVLTQKRFVKDPEAKFDENESPLNYKWTIPITYRTDQVDCETVWFHFDQPNLKIQKPKGEWLKFNCDQKGYYRINYPEAQWEDLIGRYTELNVSDRTHLLEETFSLAEAGLLNYAYPLKLTQKLKEEFDYVPWSVASSMLQSLKTYLIDSQQENAFKEYVQSIVTPAYNKCTWAESDVDDHVTRLQRIVVLNLACAVGYEECLETAKQRFDTWIQSPNETLSQDLRSLIYKYGMRSADKSTWDKMFAVFAKESDANEKLKLMNGLANVQDGVILKQLIDLAVNETYVRSQDYFTLLRYIAANPIGTSIVWDYVRENWQDLVARFTLNNRYLGSLIPGITSSFSRQIRYDEMVAFFAQNPEAGAGAASRKQALETVQNNIKWVAKYKPIVEDWIKSTPTQ